jgi:hypothetical protein
MGKEPLFNFDSEIMKMYKSNHTNWFVVYNVPYFLTCSESVGVFYHLANLQISS